MAGSAEARSAVSRSAVARGTVTHAAHGLLLGPTPDAWLAAALADLPTLLLDHAECEKKAASSALGLLYRYPDHPSLCAAASRLAREELRHYEIVDRLRRRRGIAYRRLPAGAYAAGLHALVRRGEPGRLLDTLLVAAVIEARSCERFDRLAAALASVGTEIELAELYAGLLASEARHAATYLTLARHLDGEEAIAGRCAMIAQVEWDVINAPAAALRFHSGVRATRPPAVVRPTVLNNRLRG